MDTRNLKVGDRVLVAEGYGWHGRRHKPGTVSKRTPSGILTVTVDAYEPHGTIAHTVVINANGRERGCGYSHGRGLDEFSEEVLQQEMRDEEVRQARSFLEDWKLWRTSLGDDLILKIAAMAKAELAAKPNPSSR